LEEDEKEISEKKATRFAAEFLVDEIMCRSSIKLLMLDVNMFQHTMTTLPLSSNPALRQKYRCKHSAIMQALFRGRLFLSVW